MRRFALFLSVALFAASAPVLSPGAAAAAPNAASFQEPPSAPGQLLVAYDIGTSAGERAGARSEARARRLEEVVRSTSSRRAVELVALPSGTDRDAAIRRFERNPNVAYAEPNWLVTPQVESNDPYYANGSLWGAYGDATTPANQFGSQAGEAWAAGNTGAGVLVGVIDTGVDINHPDLKGNVWVNPFDQPDGLDNDGNGYVDDVNGWDFHNGDASVYDPRDGDKHGTHVAGTIAAERNNDEGVAGVAADATFITAKFLGPNGGYTSNAIKAVDYLTDLKTRHKINLVASNNSWGGGGYNRSLYDAIERADVADVLFVAAAGNSSADNDTTTRYPSGYANTNILAVAAIDATGALSSFSNYGATSVDLGAPGSGIYSTLPGGTYGPYNGTSMAAPHVTGGVALAAASGPTTAAALKERILLSALPTPSLADRTVTGGRLDLSDFASTSAPVNSPPTARSDNYSATVGKTLSVPAPGVLENDFDPEGWTITAAIATPPIDGTVALEDDGSFTYTPASAGTHTFTYVASDGFSTSAPATVTITVAEATTTKTKGGGGGGKGGGGKPSGKGNSK